MDLEKTVSKLVKNEDEIVGALSQMVSYLETVNERFAHLEGHIEQISKRSSVIVQPRSKLFLLTVCGVSMYMGYKLADRKVQARIKEAIQQAKEQVEEQFEKAAQDAKEQAKPKTDVPFVNPN